MEWCSITVRVPMYHIFPVKNYHEEIETNDDMGVLILQTLTQIIQVADDNVMDSSQNWDVNEKLVSSLLYTL